MGFTLARRLETGAVQHIDEAAHQKILFRTASSRRAAIYRSSRPARILAGRLEAAVIARRTLRLRLVAAGEPETQVDAPSPSNALTHMAQRPERTMSSRPNSITGTGSPFDRTRSIMRRRPEACWMSL